MIQTDDGAVINVYNKGTGCPDAERQNTQDTDLAGL